jgi:hypothetical protein
VLGLGLIFFGVVGLLIRKTILGLSISLHIIGSGLLVLTWSIHMSMQVQKIEISPFMFFIFIAFMLLNILLMAMSVVRLHVSQNNRVSSDIPVGARSNTYEVY